MTFYHALQLDPGSLKRRIAACETGREKAWYWAAMAVRAVLTVLFAIAFISLLTAAFGEENTPMAVALFCILLGIRFVNFEYCIGDSLLALAAAFGILTLAPCAAALVPPLFLIPLHLTAFFALIYMTTQRPELGNGGLYSFAYIYLTGNPVAGEALLRRGLMALVGYLICGAILFAKHRHQHKEVRFRHVVRRFHLSNLVNLWQLRMALGISLVLTAGRVFGVERFMWMGFACSSLLSEYPYSGDTRIRFRQRIVGVLGGCALFLVLYQLLPESLHGLMGPLGGLCLGFCADYRYKTAINCLGALMLGAGLYGLHGAVLLRIADTLLGVVFGLVFAAVFHRLVAVKVLPKQEEEAAPAE